MREKKRNMYHRKDKNVSERKMMYLKKDKNVYKTEKDVSKRR